MERAQLATLLHTLSTHLRPDLAKVVTACADASLTTNDHSELAEQMFASFRTKKQREALQRAADLFALLAILDEARSDFAALAPLLAALPERPSARKAQSSANSARKKPQPSARKTAEVVPELADRFAKDLADALLDRDRFPKIHQQLKDGKRINTPTLHRIAQIFLRKHEAYSGRKQALEDILRRHHDALRIERQDRMFDRLN